MNRPSPLSRLGALSRPLSRLGALGGWRWRRTAPVQTYPEVEPLGDDGRPEERGAEGAEREVQTLGPKRRPARFDRSQGVEEGLEEEAFADYPDERFDTGEIPQRYRYGSDVLDIREVTLRFGGLVALDRISLTVTEGEIVGLIGPNGAGKTTLFECVSGFYRPDRGHIYYRVPEGVTDAHAGHTVDLIGEAPHRRAWLGIGRTFQNCRMFQNLSVFDALRIAQHRWMTTGAVSAGLGTKRSAVDEDQVVEATTELCRTMGLRPYQNKFCAELSYGTLRLVELAAIMALKPKFLLLDEPSSGISQRETEQLLPLLQDVREVTGSTILIIEHDMPLIMGLSDRIYAMAAGAVIAAGTPDEVQSDPAVIESYLGTSRYGTVVGANA